MVVDSKLVGIIRIESSTAAQFALRGFRSTSTAGNGWRNGFSGHADSTLVMANVPRLRRELKQTFRRLQATLVA